MSGINEMELLERNIINRYNEILKSLMEEGDMDTLEKVIMNDEYREELLHTKQNTNKKVP